MALTQISTAGVKDDAVTAGKIPANAVGSSELADNAVDTNAIADDAVTAAKLASGVTDLSNDSSPQLGGDLDTNSFEISLDDDHAIKFGNDNDLTIKYEHSSNQNKLTTSGGAGIELGAPVVGFKNQAHTAWIAKGIQSGAIELYHNGTKRFETDSNGVKVTAPEGARAELRIFGDEADDNNDYFKLSGGDGTLKIQDASNGSSWEDNIVINAAGSVELYYDNSKKFETTSLGTKVTGRINVTGNFEQDDNVKANWGNSHDLQIYHTGSFSKIVNSTGDLNLYADTNVGIYNAAGSELKALFSTNGAVELYYDNSKKLETTSYGTRTTGYHTQSTAIGFQGDAADWTASQPNMHNMSLLWNSGHLNNSTGVFTCPVAGKYLCSASVQAHRTNTTSGASSTYYNVLWQKNSGNYHVEMVGTSSTDAGARSVSDVNGKHETVTATIIMDCAANDTIRAHSNHGYRHNTQNLCSVYLLG